MSSPIQLSITEQELSQKITELKKHSGSHSPSISSLKNALPEIEFKIDACFLSNPYATNLFMSYLKKDITDQDKLRELLEYYPAQNSEIANSLGKTLGIDPQKLFIANGASEAIGAVMQNFTKNKLAVVLPTFSPYYEFAKPNQDVVFYYLSKENNFEFDVNKYLEFVKQEQPDTVILINPNNPNGNYIPVEQIEFLLKSLTEIETVIVDESFIHFAFEDDKYSPISVAKLVDQYPNLVVVKSMSKDFGIAGVRAGYVVMSEQRVKALLEGGYLWNSNGLAEYFFQLYSNEKFLTEYEPVRIKHISETQSFIHELSQISNIKTYQSYGNFVLIELPQTHPSQDVTIAMLARYGIYVRNCADKKGLEGDFLRVASRTKRENDLILKAFREIFS